MSPAAALNFWPYIYFKVLVGGCDDHGGDDARGDGSHDVVTVDLAPFIAVGRGAKVRRAVVDAVATVPVFRAHVIALLPFVVVHVLLLVGFVGVVVLSERHEWGAADAKKDE